MYSRWFNTLKNSIYNNKTFNSVKWSTYTLEDSIKWSDEPVFEKIQYSELMSIEVS